jgi:two-component system chemotaxis response regulator CheB/chemosensory pili system protein ChpB (putative protein-glutamate methylesterase)
VHNTNVAVALLYETQELGRHLRDALTSLGTPIVYEAAPANLDLAALQSSGARVVIVNLDSEGDADLDEVYGLLEDDRYSVVFNDAQASSSLSGWDQARWARHLASKILGDVDIDPPRPEGAEAIPAPVSVKADTARADEAADAEDIEIASEPDANYDTRLRSIAASTEDEHAPVAGNPLDMLESRYEEMNQPATAAFPSASPPPADAFDFSTLEALTAVPVPPPATSASPLTLAAEFLDDDEPARAPETTLIDDEPFASQTDSLNLIDEAQPIAPTSQSRIEPEAEADDFDLASLDKLFAEEPDAPPIEPVPLDVGDLGDFDALDSLKLDDAADDLVVPAGVAGLSLVDDLAFDETPTPAPVKTEQPETSLRLAAAADWSLEDMLLEGDDAPPPPSAKVSSGPADFGIEKVSAAEYLAPPTENTAPPDVPDIDFSFELMPMEEAVAPQPVEREVKETWLVPEKVAAQPKIRRVWVLGASIGGPEAVREFLGELPRDYPALFLLAQHMGVEFVDLMAQQMAKSTPLTVRTPTHGERVGHGEVVIVPTTHRMQIDPEGIVVLEKSSDEGAYSPSIDRVLRDVADRYGANAGAIIFSGMTTDAVEGSKYLAGKGGTIFAQHPDTCVVSSMIDGVVESGVVKFLGSPKELAEQLLGDSPKSKR